MRDKFLEVVIRRYFVNTVILLGISLLSTLVYYGIKGPTKQPTKQTSIYGQHFLPLIIDCEETGFYLHSTSKGLIKDAIFTCPGGKIYIIPEWVIYEADPEANTFH